MPSICQLVATTWPKSRSFYTSTTPTDYSAFWT